jgi:hypothetical protein
VAFKNINGSSVATPYVRLDSTVVTEKADQGLHRSFRSIKTVPNVALTNENAGMMDRLGKTQFEHLSLQAALQEIFNLQTEDVIELHPTFIQHANPHQTTEEGVTWKQGEKNYHHCNGMQTNSTAHVYDQLHKCWHQQSISQEVSE